ncbi:MAG: serine aminopeptidase domain-containing protein, partial [Sphingomonadaceae bacterium]
VHGFGEHSGRYRRTIRFLTDRGLSVATYDLRGHGAAPGWRAAVSMETHIRDNLAVRDAVVGAATRLAGERGPELFVPTAAGEIRPVAGSSGSGIINIRVTVNAPEGADQGFMARSGRQVAREVARAIRGAGR